MCPPPPPHLLSLAEDDVALALNGRRVEQRVDEHVGEDLNGEGDVALEDLGVVDRVLS